MSFLMDGKFDNLVDSEVDVWVLYFDQIQKGKNDVMTSILLEIYFRLINNQYISRSIIYGRDRYDQLVI